MQILEAFRALDALNEDMFPLDGDGIKGLSDFKNNDDFEDDISIIDPEAETEEDLQDNYIGKVILDCCVCHSKLYKAKEEVNIDETGELANVGEECPYCFTPDGFKVIGEVVAFNGDDEKEEQEEKEEIEEVLDFSVPINVTANDNNVAVGGMTGGLLGESLDEGIFGGNNYKGKTLLVYRGDGKDEAIAYGTDEAGNYNLQNFMKAHAKKNGNDKSDYAWVSGGSANKYKKSLKSAIDVSSSLPDWVDQYVKDVKAKNAKDWENSERQKEREAKERRDAARKKYSTSNPEDDYTYVTGNGTGTYKYRTREGLEEGIFGKKKKPAQKPTASVKAKKWQVYDCWNKYVVGEFDSKPEAEESAASRGHDGRYKVQLSESLREAKITDNPTVDIWLEELPSNYGKSSIEELSKKDLLDEIAEAKSTISNERIWARTDPMHEDNISDLQEYIEVLKELLSDKGTMHESIDDLSMTANDTHIEVGEDESGKVTVTMEPVTADGGEMIAPVSDETEAELMANEEEIPEEGEEPAEGEVDVEVDEVDEESVDELGESYFRRVYENVNSFKTTAVRQKGNSLIVEGKIKFNNGKVRKTSFMFEALDATKGGKVRFVGDNKHLTEGKKAFMLTGKMKGNKLIAESLNYNYKHEDASGKISRVYGTERTSRR